MLLLRFTPTSVGTTLTILAAMHGVTRFTSTSVGTTQRAAAAAAKISGSPPPAWGQPIGAVFAEYSSNGSPPPAWGQLLKTEPQCSPPRGSPPPAWGQLFHGCFTMFRHPVHPHQRGDNHHELPEARAIQPVHPHQRGDNVPHLERGERVARFTPTSVGTTNGNNCNRMALDGSPPPAWGQPPSPPRPATTIAGSPPPAWGQRVRAGVELEGIPVHPHQRGDNPHTRGQSNGFLRFTPTSVGTTTYNALLDYHAHRFTPTSVGTTPAWPGCRWWQWRFTPTSVGTTDAGTELDAVAPGSPPPAWGQLAGRKQTSTGKPVHPHQRGDNTSKIDEITGF